MLIRSNRPFQDGGNRETIVPEECGPLKVSGKRNEGRLKQMARLPSVSLSLSLTLPSVPLRPTAFPYPCHSLSREREQSGHEVPPGCMRHRCTATPLSLKESLFISRVSLALSHTHIPIR